MSYHSHVVKLNFTKLIFEKKVFKISNSFGLSVRGRDNSKANCFVFAYFFYRYKCYPVSGLIDKYKVINFVFVGG